MRIAFFFLFIEWLTFDMNIKYIKGRQLECKNSCIYGLIGTYGKAVWDEEKNIQMNT